MRTLWRMFKWLLALGLTALVVGLVLWHTMADQKLRAWVQQRLQQAYPELAVEVGSVRLERRRLVISELKLSLPQQQEAAPVLAIEELELRTDLTWQQLLRGDVTVQEVVIRGPRLRAVRLADGSWSIQRLWPLPRFSKKQRTLRGRIESGRLELVDPSAPGTARFRVLDFQGEFVRRVPEQGPPQFTLTGTALAEHVRQVRFAVAVVPQQKSWSLQARVQRLEVTPELLAALPRELQQQLGQVPVIRFLAEAQLRADYHPRRAEPLQFQLQGSFSRGMLDHPRLPFPLREIAGRFECTQRQLALRQVEARSRDTRLKLDVVLHGLQPGAPAEVTLQAENLPVDRQLLQGAPGPLAGLWPRFRPQGPVNLQATLSYRQGQWRAEQADVQCLGLRFVYHRLPYPVAQATGTIRLRGRRLELDLQGLAGGEPVRIVSQVENPGPEFVGWVRVQGNRIPVDPQLIAALPPRSREVLQRLRPRGTVSFQSRFYRERAGGPLNRQTTVSLNQCSIRFDKFPYRVENIRGTLKQQGRNWTFHNLQGSHGRCRISGRGRLQVADDHSAVFELELTALALPLDEELRAALPPKVQRLWTQLRPHGLVDATAQLRFHTPAKKLDLTVELEPVGRTVSIEPVPFPYRLESLEGKLVYRNGHAQWQELRAVHGPARIQTQGTAEALPGDGWRLQFSRFVAEQVTVDRHLREALPPVLRQLALKLRPNRPFIVRGSWSLEHQPQRAAPWKSTWDVELFLQQMNLHLGVLVENIHGSVRLQGTWDGTRLHSRGRLDLQNAVYQGWQFTQVRGPLELFNDRVLLGAPTAATIQPGKLPHVTAQFYGGTLWGDGWATWGAEPRFALRVRGQNVLLERLAREAFQGRQHLSGKCHGELELRGTDRGLPSLVGRGYIQLREADVYQLPLLVAMLKVLQLQLPSTTAFTTSDIRFRLQGSHIYLDRIDFAGDAISLVGAGEMNLDKQVRLVFRAEVGRSDRRIPLVGELIGATSQQILRLYVDGPLDNPRIRSEPFPLVGDTLEQIQAGLERLPGMQPVSPSPRVPLQQGSPFPRIRY